MKHRKFEPYHDDAKAPLWFVIVVIAACAAIGYLTFHILNVLDELAAL